MARPSFTLSPIMALTPPGGRSEVPTFEARDRRGEDNAHARDIGDRVSLAGRQGLSCQNKRQSAVACAPIPLFSRQTAEPEIGRSEITKVLQ